MKNFSPEIRKSGVVDVTFGRDVKIVEPVNLYGCDIGDNCFVGPFVEIQNNVTIGSGTRIQSHTFICELVTIGEDCFIGHGAMFINDSFRTGRPAYDAPEDWLPTKLGNQITIGSNATILPVEVCDHVVIGAGSVVTKDINRPGIYFGNPAVLMREIPD